MSGFLVACDGIRGTLVLAIGFTALVFLHLLTVRIDDPEPASSAPDGRKEVDLKGTIRVVAAVPGLFALIFFATFNNFIGAVFMALMDAYGLSLMNVQAWGRSEEHTSELQSQMRTSYAVSCTQKHKKKQTNTNQH